MQTERSVYVTQTAICSNKNLSKKLSLIENHPNRIKFRRLICQQPGPMTVSRWEGTREVESVEEQTWRAPEVLRSWEVQLVGLALFSLFPPPQKVCPSSQRFSTLTAFFSRDSFSYSFCVVLLSLSVTRFQQIDHQRWIPLLGKSQIDENVVASHSCKYLLGLIKINRRKKKKRCKL